MSMNGEMNVSDIEKIKRRQEFWESFEHDKWRLLSFTDKTSARFGWLSDNKQFTKYVNVRAHEARFLLGVEPDVIDQFLRDEC